MSFYILLSTITLVIVGLAVLLWQQTRSLAVVLGIGFLYYWSLYGAWFLICDLGGGDSGMHYHYLFDKIFPVHLDENYFCALVYLGLFVIIVELILFWRLVGPPLPKPLPLEQAIRISHPKLLGVCCVCGIGSFLLMRDSLAYASSNDLSIYLVTRGVTDYDAISWFTLHATLNRLALFPAAIGLAILLSGKDARVATGKGGNSILIAYIVLLAAMFIFCFILGNKNELFVALVIGVLFYKFNSLQPRTGILVLLGISAFAGVAFIDFVRASSLADLHLLLSPQHVFQALVSITASNEAFAGHMSLYGCLQYDVPLTYGSSFVSLIASIIPRNFWPDRPHDIYVHYADSLQAATGQGYSIHHAAGWYLNFGLPGILLGAIILGVVWSQLLLAGRRINTYHLPTSRLFFSFAAISFTAYLPTLVRAGLEAYKGVAIDAFLVPFAVLWFARHKRFVKQASLSEFRSSHSLAQFKRSTLKIS